MIQAAIQAWAALRYNFPEHDPSLETSLHMLKHLHIRNFAIVPTLDMDILEGFTAITGETGAGKSILVDALGLLLGDRSDAGWVRAGAARAELTAEFSVGDNIEARQWLLDAELSDGDVCLLRRTINASGRSHAFVNGSPVTVAQIQSLGNLLVEIHGQNEHLRLTGKTEKFKLLDGSGGYTEAISRVKSDYMQWSDVADELEHLDKETAISGTDLEFLDFQLAELQQHDLSPDSIELLQTEHDRLAAGGQLQDVLTTSIESLEPESASAGRGIHTGIHTILGQLQEFVSLDPDISEASQMLQEAAVNCSEAINALRGARERIDLDPARMENVANKLDSLYELARKHRVHVDELEQLREVLVTRIERAGSSEQRRTELEIKLETMLGNYRNSAKNLHLKRKQHAANLSQDVIALMDELGMQGGHFELSASLKDERTPTPLGDDDLQILISANPGLPPGPLNKIASGGELSRISLAIKVAANGHDDAVTQIFDEVDAGIGGDTANAVGHLLKRLAGDGQAMCVTHLAQVAVCASHQLRVRKLSTDDLTAVDTNLLNRNERVDEIARMLSGRISEQSRAHAAELLDVRDQDFLGRT